MTALHYDDDVGIQPGRHRESTHSVAQPGGMGPLIARKKKKTRKKEKEKKDMFCETDTI